MSGKPIDTRPTFVGAPKQDKPLSVSQQVPGVTV